MLLRSDRLSVLVGEPGIGWASTTRFDRTGVITSILFDGEHRFCTPEQILPGRATSGGIGLTAEFQTPGIIADTPVGQRYHKIGVGMLENDGRRVGPYSAVDLRAEPYPTQMERLDEVSVRFEQRGSMLNGYAFLLERIVQVRDNTLAIKTCLRNLGEKHLAFSEYNHNFVNIDDHPTGPQYVLEFSYDMPPEESPRGILSVQGRRCIFTGAPDTPFYAASSAIGDALAYYWTLSREGVSISEELSKKPMRVAIWGVEHVISSEVFTGAELPPMEETGWSRIWTFSKG